MATNLTDNQLAIWALTGDPHGRVPPVLSILRERVKQAVALARRTERDYWQTTLTELQEQLEYMLLNVSDDELLRLYPNLKEEAEHTKHIIETAIKQHLQKRGLDEPGGQRGKEAPTEGPSGPGSGGE